MFDEIKNLAVMAKQQNGFKKVVVKSTHRESSSVYFGFLYERERESNALIDRVSFKDQSGWESRIVAVIS